MIFSSMVSVATKRVALTGRVWPIRCALCMACSSDAGFHHGSMMKMWSAACRLRPSPPAFSEIRSTFREGSVWKEMMILFLEVIGMVPNTLAALMPSRFILHSMSSKKRVNCEKTSALLLGSAACIWRISYRSASILVEVLNSAVLMRCMMLPLKLCCMAICVPLELSSAPPAAAVCTVAVRCGGNSSLPASPSSKLSVKGLKQVGHPMPPLGS
mmetsp:Transcript_136683/g.340850  ORF Transcript_136683/g.340850 Transcript_136683/m.340850 type:complete len:214 (+) Transcript_136683:296-937(+)